MRLGEVILPEQVWAKIKGFGEGRIGHTAEPKPAGIGPNMPGPPVAPHSGRNADKDDRRRIIRLSICERQIDGLGFRPADARFVRRLARCPASRCAAFLADRFAGRETELTTPSLISL